MDNLRSELKASKWPSCGPEQVRVMLVGTYHMDNPRLDEANVSADDVLTDDRQAEIREAVNRLAEWKPHRIAVEQPRARSEGLNTYYQEYRSGEHAYDQESTFSPPEGDIDWEIRSRSEVVQVGFRLGDHLGHDAITAIDERPNVEQYSPDPVADGDVDSTRKTGITVRDPDEMEAEQSERLASLTVSEYLAQLNSENELRANHDIMFDRAIRGTDERFGSPVELANWYDRNIRMVHHVWQTMAAEDTRILLLVGSGHIRALRHLLTESPMFCPVSPLPYLLNLE